MIYTDGMHLTATTLKELHKFAEDIGLDIADFNDGKHKHYTLSPSQADLVKKNGAKTITTESILEIIAK